MANKEQLKKGIAQILSTASVEVTRSRNERDHEQHGAASSISQEPITQDERDLLNSVEDAEFRKELERRLIAKRLIGRGRPRKNDIEGRRMDGYDRTSVIINKEKWAKVKEIALRETLTIKEIMDATLDIVIQKYEDKHGTVVPQQREKKDASSILF